MEKNNIEISIVSSDKDYEDMKNVRRAVFVEEHNIPEDMEFDGNDHMSTHVLARDKEEPIGTMRIRYFADFAKFERMAVIKSKRGNGGVNVADLIMKKGIEFVQRKGYCKIYGVCKKELLPRWQKCNYNQIAGAPLIEQNGMTLIPIMLQLEKHENAIKITDHPSLITGIEDRWDDIKIDEKKNKEKTHVADEQKASKIAALLVSLTRNRQKK